MVPHHSSGEPAQRLATAVLKRAVYDAAGVIEKYRYTPARTTRGGGSQRLGHDGLPLTKESLMREALLWLTTPSAALQFWCGLLDLDEQTMIDNVDAAIEQAQRASRIGEK